MQESFDDQIYQEQKQKIVLNNVELLELTYNDEKFIKKIHQFNKQGCTCINEEEYEKAMAYFDEAEKVLEYSASCGKTIQRNLITTILNNQAALLQRVWQLERSASYLEAIIYNITELLDAFPKIAYNNPKLWQDESEEYSELATYFERKSALALYHLRFSAVSSQAKNNEAAHKSAITALTILKQLCCELNVYQKLKLQQNPSKKIEPRNRYDNLLEELSKIKQITVITNNIYEKYLSKAIEHIQQFQQRVEKIKPSKEIQTQFGSYSIGHLMQTNLIFFQSQQQNQHNKILMKKQLTVSGKIYKVLHISIAYFTIATELRLICSKKYTLDDEEKKLSKEFKISEVYHLLSIIIAAKYLPCKSIYFDHLIFSFKNHYQINLLEYSRAPHEVETLEESSIFEHDSNKQSQNHHERSLSNLQNNSIAIESIQSQEGKIRHLTSEEDDHSNRTIEIHQNQEEIQLQGIPTNQKYSAKSQTNQLPLLYTSTKEIKKEKENENRIENGNHLNKIKSSRSKPHKLTKNISNHNVIEISRKHDDYYQVSRRDNEILKYKESSKSKGKSISHSNKKDLLKSRKKDVKYAMSPSDEKTDNIQKCIYYQKNKSRSKSKKGHELQKKLSKKHLGINNEGKKSNKFINKIEEQYGIKSIGTNNQKMVVSRQIKASRFSQYGQQNQKLQIKMNKVHSPEYFVKNIKKIKSPRGENKSEHVFFQKKRVSKEVKGTV